MFKNFPKGAKVQSYDDHGYYIMEMCGTIAEVLPNGHAIIKSFDGYYYSSIGIRYNRITEVEFIS